MERAATLEESPTGTRWQPPGWRRSLQLVLATAWLLDGILQLQPFMFSHGAHGFSGMLAGTAAGNPGPVASSIRWMARAVGAHSAPANLAFASFQILLGLGIAWRRSAKAALAASIPWAVAVWWFGEGLGGVLHGTGAPVVGGPGAVLLYALLAVVLWPAPSAGGGGETTERSVATPFAAVPGIGAAASRAIWAALWAAMAALSLLGGARSPASIGRAISSVDAGEPGWLTAIDRHAAAIVSGRGLVVAVVIAVICLVVAAGVYLPPAAARAVLVLAILTSIVIWTVTENFGTILAGGATDPNSGPMLVVLAFAYWPVRARQRAAAPVAAPARAGGSELATAASAELVGAG